MCWSAKWHGEKQVHFDSLHESKPPKMLKGIHKLLDEADAVAHYNGTKFDIPTLNKEFLIHGITPPSPYKQIDLLRVAKRQFRFPSNKLEYVAKALKCTPKLVRRKYPGHELWIQCMREKPNREAWAEMKKYNVQDTRTLEEVYDKLVGWIPNPPNRGLYAAAAICPNCGSDKLQRRGTQRTVASVFNRYQCQGCGAWSRAGKSSGGRLIVPA